MDCTKFCLKHKAQFNARDCIIVSPIYLAGCPFCHIFLCLQQYLSLVYTTINLKKQAGAELGQAQLKLVLDFTGTELCKISGQILTNLENSSG